MDFTGWGIFVLAFGAGLLHALDADHVMAVTAMSAKKVGIRAIVNLCLKWSLGHGAVILFVGASILIFGVSLPDALSHYAEKAVAILLLVLGGWILWDLYRSRAHFHFHEHHGTTRHAHWHIKETETNNAELSVEHKHGHRAVMVGVLHGLAGLAPLLALVPIAKQPVWLAITYLLIFCLGVFLSMLIFGGVLGKVIEGIQKYSVLSINVIRGLVGISSISLGLVWLA